MGAYSDKIKQYYSFSRNEVLNLIVTVVIIAFIFSFNDRSESFNILFWLNNYAKTVLIVAFAFFVHVSMQKIIALGAGYRAEYQWWPYGLTIGVVISFISNGSLFILLPGGIFVHHLAIHRLGLFRYGISQFYSMYVGFSGAAANLIIGFLCKLLFLLTGLDFFSYMMMINLWIAIFTFLPIPPLDGSLGFFGGRSTYMLLLGLTLGFAIMIALSSTIWVMLVGTIIIMILFWFVYYWLVERMA